MLNVALYTLFKKDTELHINYVRNKKLCKILTLVGNAKFMQDQNLETLNLC